MNIDAAKRKVIHHRKSILSNVQTILKSEFIGLDDVIDNVINSFEPWFVFPEYVTKPIIINLWGMTGTGKTSLVRRLAELTEHSNRLINIDMAEFSDKYHSTLRNFITDGVVADKSPLIFCLDEFQFARTISETDSEIDRQGTRMIWEFIDTGKVTINKRDVDTYLEIGMLCEALKECQKLDLDVKNGQVIKKKKVFLQTLDDFYLNYGRRNHDNDDKVNLVPDNFFDDIYEFSKDRFKDRKDFKDFLMNLNLVGTITFIEELLESNKISKVLDFSNSVIFIIGNLDEAYHLSSDIDPDQDPDLFHEQSKLINLSTIKSALLERFRHEQVSRLGNNHIIYPAFSSAHFKLLIQKELDKASAKFIQNFGLGIEFTNNINDLIYKESVFPTEGARPVITSVNLLIESYFSKIINDICLKYDTLDSILWDYSNEYYQIACYLENEKVDELNYRIQLKVEKDRKSKHPDFEALVSVHECGHAVVAALVTRMVPKKISCVSANDNAEGRTILNHPERTIYTKKYMLERIMIALGGFLAQKMIFGDENITSGVVSDLQEATNFALRCIKSYGMGSEPIAINVPSLKTNEFFFSREKHQIEAMNIINDCKVKTEELLLRNKKVLLELSKVLTNKLTLDSVDIEIVIKEFAVEEWVGTEGFINQENYYNFKEILFG